MALSGSNGKLDAQEQRSGLSIGRAKQFPLCLFTVIPPFWASLALTIDLDASFCFPPLIFMTEVTVGLIA